MKGNQPDNIERALRQTVEIKDHAYPIMRSFIVLRQEHFGGYLFNPYLPPELRLDPVRFKIAALCDGKHRVREIKEVIGSNLQHSKEYIDILVNKAMTLFGKSFALYWREKQIEIPKDFGIKENHPILMEEKRQLSAPLFVIWEITAACNLRCKHCLSDAGKPVPGELNTAEAKRLIDDLETLKVFNINFSGGEPLLRPDIFELLRYASGKKIGIDLLTNGALITKEVVQRLRDTNIFHVQVSIDGIGKTHDDFRGIPGSFDRAIQGITHLKDADFGVAISSAVTRHNLEQIPQLIDMAVDLGVSLYKTTLFMPAGRGKGNADQLVLDPQDVKNFTYMMMEKKEEVGDKIVISNEELYPWLTEKREKERADILPGEDLAKVGCTAGNSSLYITPEGKITPCPFLRDFTAGDTQKESLREIWENSSTFDIFRNIRRGDLKGQCSGCEFLGVSCYGGCRASAYAQTGDLYGEDPLCWKRVIVNSCV